MMMMCVWGGGGGGALIGGLLTGFSCYQLSKVCQPHPLPNCVVVRLPSPCITLVPLFLIHTKKSVMSIWFVSALVLASPWRSVVRSVSSFFFCGTFIWRTKQKHMLTSHWSPFTRVSWLRLLVVVESEPGSSCPEPNGRRGRLCLGGEPVQRWIPFRCVVLLKIWKCVF